MPTFRFVALIGLVALALAGACKGSRREATIRGCTQTTLGTTTGPCETGFFIDVSDAPLGALASFHVTLDRVELITPGGPFLFCDGSRRENLLDFRTHSFLLTIRDDLPELDVVGLRIHFHDPVVRPSAAIERDGTTLEVLLPETLELRSLTTCGVRLDFDVAKSLERMDADNLRFRPVVFAHLRGASDHHPLETLLRGTLLENDDDRLTISLDGAAGEITVFAREADVFHVDLTPASVRWLRTGDALEVVGTLLRTGDLLAHTIVREPDPEAADPTASLFVPPETTTIVHCETRGVDCALRLRNEAGHLRTSSFETVAVDGIAIDPREFDLVGRRGFSRGDTFEVEAARRSGILRRLDVARGELGLEDGTRARLLPAARLRRHDGDQILDTSLADLSGRIELYGLPDHAGTFHLSTILDVRFRD